MISRKIFCKNRALVVVICLVARADQKVLRFHTLINKMVKINYRVTIIKY